jgi:hypothetical protein
MVRCNTGLEFTCGSFKAQSFSWALIEAQGYLVEVGLGIAGQVTQNPVSREAPKVGSHRTP